MMQNQIFIPTFLALETIAIYLLHLPIGAALLKE
jgi:hypothetical protein